MKKLEILFYIIVAIIVFIILPGIAGYIETM